MQYRFRTPLIVLLAAIGGILGSYTLAPYHRGPGDPFGHYLGAAFGMAYGLALGVFLRVITSPSICVRLEAIRIPRFTIRDLMWLTAVVGIACGWLVSHFAWTDSYTRLLNTSRRESAKQQSNIDALTHHRDD